MSQEQNTGHKLKKGAVTSLAQSPGDTGATPSRASARSSLTSLTARSPAPPIPKTTAGMASRNFNASRQPGQESCVLAGEERGSAQSPRLQLPAPPELPWHGPRHA